MCCETEKSRVAVSSKLGREDLTSKIVPLRALNIDVRLSGTKVQLYKPFRFL